MPIKKKVKLTEKEICDKWLNNKNVNPETSRKIKETGDIYKKLVIKCLKKNNKIKSDDTIYLSAKSSVITESKNKINAYKKIQKLFNPYIKRVSMNIIDRINYYLIIKKYLLTIKDKNNCFRLYDIDNKNNKPIYRVGKNIILDKQIGSSSVHGIVFLSYFKSNIKYGNKFDKLNKFAVKITNQSNENKNEINVLNKLTKLVIDFKCPHFPISYGSFNCNNPNIKSNNPDINEVIKKYDKKLFPELIKKNNSYLIQINELASGDLSNNLISGLNKDIFNTLTQVLISIMFFHYYTKSYHKDLHAGNFLYHKIKPGGYFHYNIYGTDYYLENKGYLWVIWDFGLIEPFNKSKSAINYDFNHILDTLYYYEYKLTDDEEDKIEKLLNDIIYKYNKIYDTNLLENINKEILDYLLLNVASFTTNKPLNIINNKPYTINKNKIETKQTYFNQFFNYFTKK